MAKKTKDSNLSLEERLEQALIPNWDEPYKLPENWCWVYLTKGFAQCLDSFRKPVNASERSEMQGDIPYYGATGQVGWINNYLTNEHLVLLGEDGAPFLDYEKNKAYIIQGKAWVNNHAHILKSFYGEDSNLYLMHYLNVFNYHGYVNGSTRLKLTQESMNSIPVPLAPIDEQQRIVARIESLFAKLDEAKEKAQEVVDGFETRKAAILHKAFSGELTAKWREENGIPFDEWNNKLFDECIEKMQNGLAKRNGSTGIPYVVLRLANLSDDGFVTDDLREIVLDEKEQKSYKLNVCDVVMIRVNGSKDNVAKQILVTEDNLWAFCDHIIRIKYNESVLPEYMVLYSKSEAYKIYVKDNIVSSAGQNTISRKGMARLSIPVPSIEEQKEIANILSDMFDKERRVKEIAEAVIEQIDTMKKAILARAFRGELGTNNPSEESAVELLKKVLGGDADVQSPAKKTTKRTSIPSDIKELLSNIREEEIIKLLLKSAPQPVSIQEIMSISSKKFEIMDALRSLEKKQFITKNESGDYSLTR
jgi:type I restriction enzyme S subunit